MKKNFYLTFLLSMLMTFPLSAVAQTLKYYSLRAFYDDKQGIKLLLGFKEVYYK
jgi:hypothetical protein